MKIGEFNVERRNGVPKDTVYLLKEESFKLQEDFANEVNRQMFGKIENIAVSKPKLMKRFRIWLAKRILGLAMHTDSETYWDQFSD